MSSNTVRARLAFSFKAATYDLEATIDLDQCVGEAGEEPDFHQLIARAHGIDPYSYLYEVLESHEIEFSDPTGIVAHCCRDGHLDWHALERRWHEEQDLQVVRAIVARTMGIADLDAHADLREALLAAYRAGHSA